MKDNFFKFELLGSALVSTYVGRIGRDIISVYSWGGVQGLLCKNLFCDLFLLTNSI